MTVLVIIIVIAGVVIYKRNTPDAKKKRAAKKAYLDAVARRCNQFMSLGRYAEVGCEIAFREYTTFSHNGESVSDYFDRVNFRSLPTEVQDWYYW